MKTVTFFLSALSFVSLVVLPLIEAHGIIGQITIDGMSYQGPIAGGDPIPGSPVRQISDASPVKGANNIAITCGPDAKPASFVAPANPGSAIGVLWQANDRQHWPHNTGPMEVYLASCGSVSCDQFDASNAQWFKIDQVGQRGDGWVQQDQFDGKPHSFTLPSTLAAGGYLLRHEIIALHLADHLGGAEFYPGCVQINVGGDQTGVPSPNELVHFPGAYSDEDPGILVNAFSGAPYVFPGPPISMLAGSPSSSPMPSGGMNSSSPMPSGGMSSSTPTRPSPSNPVLSNGMGPSASNPAQPSPVSSDDMGTSTLLHPSATAPPDDGSGDCHSNEERTVYDDYDRSYYPSIPAPAPKTPKVFKPRHFSRVMARLAKSHGH